MQAQKKGFRQAHANSDYSYVPRTTGNPDPGIHLVQLSGLLGHTMCGQNQISQPGKIKVQGLGCALTKGNVSPRGFLKNK